MKTVTPTVKPMSLTVMLSGLVIYSIIVCPDGSVTSVVAEDKAKAVDPIVSSVKVVAPEVVDVVLNAKSLAID